MNYLLSEAEFTALKDAARIASDEVVARLQEACITAAKHTPITRPWSPESPPAPWGCILDETSHPGYCDECPVRHLCPYDHKEWSQ